MYTRFNKLGYASSASAIRNPRLITSGCEAARICLKLNFLDGKKRCYTIKPRCFNSIRMP